MRGMKAQGITCDVAIRVGSEFAWLPSGMVNEELGAPVWLGFASSPPPPAPQRIPSLLRALPAASATTGGTTDIKRYSTAAHRRHSPAATPRFVRLEAAMAGAASYQDPCRSWSRSKSGTNKDWSNRRDYW